MAPIPPSSWPVGPCPGCGSASFRVEHVLDWPSGLVTYNWGCACGVTGQKVVPHGGPGYASGGWIVPSPWVHGGYQVGVQSGEPLRAPDPEPDDEETPVISGSVIGYRAWRLVDWQLYGTAADRAWVPGVNEATCDPGMGSPRSGFYFATPRPPHAAPAIGCDCGITALARFAKHDSHWAEANVFGAIEAWSDETADGDGRFILHKQGFRAQFAKIVLLAIDPEWRVAKQAAVRALAQEHGADVCTHDHLEDAAKEHGQLVPDDMLKWAARADATPDIDGGAQAQSFAALLHSSQVAAEMSARLQAAMSTMVAAQPKPERTCAKGIRQTLGYPGPPQGRTTKYAKGDRVRDANGVVWACEKAGRPGLWAAE